MKPIKIIVLTIISIVILTILLTLYLKPMWEKMHLPKPVQINTQNQPMLGNPQAKIHFVIFEDLKCINCAKFNNTVLPYLKERYINTGLANYTMINLAFVPGSLPAANAAHCVYVQNPALFFPLIDYLYQHQPPENQDWATVPTLMNMASKIPGINIDQLGACILKSPYDQLIADNLKQAAQLMNGSVQTPMLYVNGIAVKNPTLSEIDKVVDAVK